jgi:predicted DNA-binding transcriptional regulator AlpA
MAKARGSDLTDLPPVIPEQMLLTPTQAMKLTGRTKSRFYADVKDGVLPPPAQKDKRFVRWLARDLFRAMGAE